MARTLSNADIDKMLKLGIKAAQGALEAIREAAIYLAACKPEEWGTLFFEFEEGVRNNARDTLHTQRIMKEAVDLSKAYEKVWG